MVMSMAETWGSLGSGMAALMFAWTMYQNYFPRELRGYFSKYTKKISYYFYPYIQINFPEYQGDDFQRSRAYTAIQRYLDKSSSDQARRLKANVIHGSESIVFTMEANEEVTDEFRGIKLWWSSRHHIPDRQTISWGGDEEKKSFNLTFHKKHRETVTVDYLKYVLEQGKEIAVKERRRKLYTNIKGEGRWFERQRMWSHITFEHPASFETLAMESKKKQEIIDDLINFSNSKDYYAKVGKAWKRGYLLYGPPGTGKSTMIAAMANLLKYDVYDLELTSVKDNTDLRKLLIDTSSKSIIVIEDIDCSLDLTGQREKGKAGQNEKDKDKDKDKEKEKSVEEIVKKKMEESKKSSEVTLSGLLNFIDGLWSSCGEERIIVFTTNYVEKLDPALIRRGRMDKRIELSYCGLQAFKDLAKIYLNVEWHDLFAKVGSLLEVTKMTPADVAENLMPKFVGEDVEFCLERLIVALGEAKVEQDAKAKAEEEAKAKAEEEAKAKAEEEAKTKAEEDAKAKVKAEEEAKSKALATSAETKTENGTESVSKSSSETENVAKEVKENGCTSTTNGN